MKKKDIIIIILLGVIFWLSMPKDEIKPVVVEKKDTTIFTRLDGANVNITVDYTPKEKIKVVKVTEYRPEIIDSGAIVMDWLAKRVYNDTLYNDSLGFVAVIDTVTHNRITHRRKIVKLHPIIQNNIKLTEVQKTQKWQFFVGGQTDIMPQIDLAAKIDILHNGKRLYSISYSPFTQNTSVAIAWKLGK